MKLAEALFFLTALSILLIFFLAQLPHKTIKGKITSISFQKNSIKITLSNTNKTLIAFTKYLPLKKGDLIEIETKPLGLSKQTLSVEKIWRYISK